MNTKAIRTTVQMEALLYFRGIFGPFFSFLFPLLMLFLFGGLYGNEPSALFQGRGSMDVSVPSYLGMVIAVGGLMSLPLSLIEYQATKAYKRFDATPIGKLNIVFAQVSVHFVTTVAASLVLVMAGILLYNIRIDGQWFVILPLFLLSLASMFSLGFLVTALCKNTKAAQFTCYILYFVMLFLSGSSFPSELFPANIRALSNLLPLTHAVQVLKNAFAGYALTDVWGSVAVLGAVTVLCMTIGAAAYRRRSWV